eukprot:449530_1
MCELKEKLLGDVIDDIQTLLHNQGKELIQAVFNNKMRHLIFKTGVDNAINDEIVELEFEEIQENKDLVELIENKDGERVLEMTEVKDNERTDLGNEIKAFNSASKTNKTSSIASLFQTISKKKLFTNIISTNPNQSQETKNDEQKPTYFFQGAVQYVEETNTTETNTTPIFPLSVWGHEDICRVIKNWKYNDISYKATSMQMKHVFNRYVWTGTTLRHTSNQQIKDTLRASLSNVMTEETINIMLDFFVEWKAKKLADLESKSIQQISQILHDHPLDALLVKIAESKIKGEQVINELIQNKIIKSYTGWNQDEVYQLEAILLRNNTFMYDEFVNNMKNVFENTINGKTLPNQVIMQIKNTILKFDVLQLHFAIKNNHQIIDFSDCIINMVDELSMQHNEENNFETDFVKRVYEAIAECFVLKYDLENINSSLIRGIDWICCNCGCNNFSSLISSHVNTDLSTCSLCGIAQKDAIILKLRNYDTFTMVNDKQHDNDTEEIKYEDDIDELIHQAIDSKKIDLLCLNKNNNEPCESMLRLAKQLIKYKRWLHTISGKKSDNINITVQVDISKYIDNNTFVDLILKSAKNIKQITETDLQQLMKIFDNNDTMNIQIFTDMHRKTFISKMKTVTNIKPAALGRIYTIVMKRLKSEAQKKEFGKYISELNIEDVLKDYHHILKSHINNGNAETIKNAFLFFGNTVHYEDTGSEIENCASFKRRQARATEIDTQHVEAKQDE